MKRLPPPKSMNKNGTPCNATDIQFSEVIKWGRSDVFI